MAVSHAPVVRSAPLTGPLALAGLVGLALAGRLASLGDVAVVQTFVLIFTSIVVEALPFILLGSLVSAAIEVYVPARAFARVGRLPLPLQLPAAALGGIAFPVCECGSVPVARRLIGRGLHPSAGIAFMLAAPIINPVVLASTAIAYAGRGLAVEMVLARACLGLIVAVVAGWALGSSVSRPQAAATGPPARAGRKDVGELVRHLTGDFFFMGRFLVLGAALAAALQTIVPQSLVAGVALTPVVGSLALMALAFALSLCSEADAFVAVSLAQFPLGAQLAFLVFGPVADVKLAFLYGASFSRRFVVSLVVIAVPVVLAGSLWAEVLLT